MEQNKTDNDWLFSQVIELLKSTYQAANSYEDADLKMSKTELIEHLSSHFPQQELFDTVEFYKAMKKANFNEAIKPNDSGFSVVWIFKKIK